MAMSRQIESNDEDIRLIDNEFSIEYTWRFSLFKNGTWDEVN